MLNKNIYLLYPPGYSGNYVSWVLSKSEKHSRDSTVDDPVNKSRNDQYGGKGTSHLHVRVPTHQGIIKHLTWMIYNRPTDPMIYLINGRDHAWSHGWQGSSEEAMTQILMYDPDPVFIHIHDGDEIDWRRVGNINCISKWPAFFRSEQKIEKVFKFDAYNIDNLHTRNVFAEFRNKIFPGNSPIGLAYLQNKYAEYQEWYRVRNSYNPHEVNEKTYLVPDRNSIQVHQLHLKDIMCDNLFDNLQSIVEQADCGIYDFGYARDFHHNYLDAQTSLEWFDIIEKFKTQTVLDHRVLDSTMYQALLLEIMLPTLKDKNVDWKILSIEQCLDAYVSS